MIRTVKYANDIVLSAKEETVSATGYARLTVGNLWNGNEILEASTPQHRLRQIKTNWKMWNISTISITNNARCTCEIKSRIAMAKAAFIKKKTLFTRKSDLNLRTNY